VRRALARLDAPGGATHETLSRLASEAGLRTESGQVLRFVPPSPDEASYELRVFETGCVETRPGNRHDLFNALAWLAFPRTKARINALHAAQIPEENGVRGRLRDLLTLLDEGGAIVPCADEELVRLVREFRWTAPFWTRRAATRAPTTVLVLGHAVLEKALDPWPGIACKALFVEPGEDPDAQAAAWLGSLGADATPQLLVPLPVFGFPAWDPANERAEYYDDTRYFRPFRRDPPPRRAVKWHPGVGRAAAVPCTEESPGSAERDAG